MSKICNERMKGRTLTTSFGEFKFDLNGVAEIPDEHINKLLTLKGYRVLGDIPEQSGDENEDANISSTNEENAQNDDSNDEEQDAEDEDNTDEGITPEELDKMTVPQLKKIAKDNDIDLNGATKKDAMIPIILGALSK